MPEAGRPWEADRSLSLEGARTAITGHFPDVEVRGLRWLGSGWEFDVCGTPDGWVFRFPRRAEHAKLFEREERILELVAPVLEPLVALPRVELKGSPCDAFPYAFAGHRAVPGVSADLGGRSTWNALAGDIGSALSRLHEVREVEARRAGLDVDPDGCTEWLAEARRVSQDLRGLGPIVEAEVEWVETVTEVPGPYEGPLRVIHNDLKPEHLLVSPDSGRLVGMIDWTDTGLGDPVLDFVGFMPWRGARFLDAVLAGYEVPLDAGFRERVRFLSRVLSLVWLQESVERDPDGGKKHVEWVKNAFARVD